MTTDQKVAIVTGSSNGIGYATSLILARNGFRTYATMKNKEKSDKVMGIAAKEKLPLTVTQLNVNDDKSVNNAIEKILSESGERIDILVNNAGITAIGSAEDLSIEELKTLYETNLFGQVRVIQAVLPVMRKQKNGTIVNVSSAIGRIGFPILSGYVSTKFAIEGISESMKYELEPFGIRIVIIEPGFIKTNLLNSSVTAKKAGGATSAYYQMTNKMKSFFSTSRQNGSEPEEVAKTILHAVTTPNPEFRYTPGQGAEQLLDARRKMSDEELYNMISQNILPT
jgi:NAD(P)-dependent dehydrogenase (short-subunit alcohol dehydrogenase family)